jgi:hypothetical protein
MLGPRVYFILLPGTADRTYEGLSDKRRNQAFTAGIDFIAENGDGPGLAKRVKAKILQASTSEVYGDPTVHPQPEEYWGHVNPIGPRSCYDEGKRCAETLFFDYWRQHNLRIKVARIFNTYGPRMQGDRRARH